jgi:hypothetical protein
MVLPIDRNSAVYRCFSRQTGAHPSDDVIEMDAPILAISYDATNNCHWVVTSPDQTTFTLK